MSWSVKKEKAQWSLEQTHPVFKERLHHGVALVLLLRPVLILKYVTYKCPLETLQVNPKASNPLAINLGTLVSNDIFPKITKYS